MKRPSFLQSARRTAAVATLVAATAGVSPGMTARQGDAGCAVVPDEHTRLLDRFDGATAGTAVGILRFQPGLAGLGSAAVIGPGIYVQYAIPPLSPAGTIELWLRPQLETSVDQSILALNWGDHSSFPRAGHIGSIRHGPGVRFTAWNVPGNLASPTPLAAGRWTHVAVTWGPDRSLLYVDGEIEASYDGNASPAFIATNYAYLNHWGEGRTGPDRPGIEEASYHGLVDELHLSDIQRTAEEIRRHADCARSEPGR